MSQENEVNDVNEQAEAPAEQSGGAYIGAGATDESIVVEEPKQGINRGTLVVFAVLVIGAAGLFVMYKKAGPSSAVAATKETVEAKKTISTFLSGGDSSIKTMEALIKNTEKVVQQFLAYPSMTQVPLSDLHTNPFRVREEKTVRTPDNNSSSEALEKKKREEERLAILKSVQSLQVKSIMWSESRKACMINSSLYVEGQMVDGFIVEKITPTAVSVKNGPYRFELRIQR